jgi:alpha-glucosidase
MPDDTPSEAAWWQRGTIYHVYPRSFQDSDADGVGDLEGIRRRLPYLAWLGVDAVWLSPIYRSPMADFGYDVSDHCDVDPLFGTLADWDRLAADARRLGLRLILDFVPNHTSIEHPWFAESRAGPRRSWYLWRDGSPRRPPTNWVSAFGGSAWEWDSDVGRWYYHAYLAGQPDLNWREPAVRDAMTDVMRFWMARGADGFRVDALRQCIKDDAWRDNPPDPRWRPGEDPYDALVPEFTTDRPQVQEIVRLLRSVVDAAAETDGRDRVLIGELYLPIERLMAYYDSGLHLPANLHLLSTPWESQAIRSLVEIYEGALPAGAWPNWVLGNHDRSRLASRIGADQARAAAVLLLTLRGTPTLYYGDELGMRDVAIPAERAQDPWERRVPGQGLGRDPERTPMQWGPGPKAGFCGADVEPWLPIAGDAHEVNVLAQRDEPTSLLSLYRALLSLRRTEPALSLGGYATLSAGDGAFAYERRHGRSRFVVALNLGSEPCEAELDGASGVVALGTGGPSVGERVDGRVRLGPGEAVIVACRR